MTGTKSKILYFDPNNTRNQDSGDSPLETIFNGIDIMKDPEDFGISIDLEVEVKNRENIVVGEKLIATVNGPSSVNNFLQGKEIGGVNVLTTYFTDLTYSENGDNYDNEALSISSIDIEFTSWYVASVIIKFTDVRGAGLFSQAESNEINPETGKKNSDNVFSPFFTMPYPIFKLKVKGIYGDAVRYPLHCTDFKAEFNNEKGNFDIVAHFIGYTYAMLSDIQVTYLMAAPYLKTYGSSYWSSQVNSGRFKTLEGRDLPKIPELMKRIKTGTYIQDKISNTDIDVEAIKKIKATMNSMSAVYEGINEYGNILNNSTYKFNLNKNVYTLSISKNASFKVDDINLKVQIDKVKKLIKETNDNILINKIGDVDIIQSNGFYTVDLDQLYRYVDAFKSENNAVSDRLSEKITSTLNNSLVSVYEMVPSIFNFTKMILAHIETLIYSIGACAKDAAKEDRGSHKNGRSDIKDDKLSPFPWISDGNGHDEWLGNVYPRFSEVDFVKDFVEARTTVQNEINKLELYDPSIDITSVAVSNGEYWYPLNAFDNSIVDIGYNNQGKTPYSIIGSLDSEGVNNLKLLLALRATMAIQLTSDGSNDDIRALALGESRNILLNYQDTDDLTKITASIKSIIDVAVPSVNSIKLKTEDGFPRYYPLTNETTNPKNTKYSFKITKDDTINSRFIPLYPNTFKGYCKLNNKNIFYNYENAIVIPPIGKHTALFPISVKILTGGTEFVRNIEKSLITKTVENIKGSDFLNKIVEGKYSISRESSSTYITDKLLYSGCQAMNRITNKTLDISENDSSKENYKKYIDNFFSNMNSLDGFKTIDQSKNNRETYIKNYEKTDILNYPIIGGFEKWNINRSQDNNNIFTLFGNMIYYVQEQKAGKGKVDLYANERKAWLFLQTLPLDDELIEKTIVNIPETSVMLSMPRAALLLAGSMLWKLRVGDRARIIAPNNIDSNEYKLYDLSSSDYLKESYGDMNIEVQYTGPALSKWKAKYVRWQISESCKKTGLGNLKNERLKDKLVDYFLSWAKSSGVDGWATIRDSFELKKLDGSLFYREELEENIDEFSKLSSNAEKLKYINTNFKDFFKNYSSINKPSSKTNKANTEQFLLVNNQNSRGVKGVLSLLLSEDIIATAGKFTDNNLIDGSIVQLYFNTIKGEIEKILKNSKKTTAVDSSKSGENKDPFKLSDNEDYNLQVYRYLKILYDKWVSGCIFDSPQSEYKWIDSTAKTNINGYITSDINNFKFIDRAYRSIGDKFIINLKDVFDSVGGFNDQRSSYSVLTDILSKNQFLFLPMPNYQSWSEQSDFAKIFQPIPYIESSMNKDENKLTSIFICMYSGNLSKSLNIGSSNYFYQDDALNLNTRDENIKIEPDFEEVDRIDEKSPTVNELDKSVIENDLKMQKVPVFEVNYGKQNQSYFKTIVLNMNNPNITDVGVNVIKSINERSNNKSSIEPIGQDLYTIYSQYAYTCQVEMLGCPQIQPMMYFQLQNIPMWNGAYLIYKVNHSIRAGNMTTTFTGMRLGKNYAKFINGKGVSFESLGVSVSGMDISIVDPNNKISGKTLESMLGNQIGKHFTLRDYIVDGSKMGHQIYISEGIESRLKKLAETIDSIYDTWTVSPNGVKYGPFKINSAYRTQEDNDALSNSSKTSSHVQGLAADIGFINVKYTNSEMEKALYEHVLQRMRDGLKMDQLLLESGKTMWCHISPAGFSDNTVKVRGQYAKTDKDGHANDGNGYRVIDQAKDSGRLMDINATSEDFIKYLKKAENGNKVGWEKDEKDLWSPLPANSSEIGYGIVFRLKNDDGVYVPNVHSKGLLATVKENILTPEKVRATEDVIIEELNTQMTDGLRDIKKYIDTEYGSGSFDKIEDKYKYAIFDLYYNFGSGGYKKNSNNINFIKCAVGVDLKDNKVRKAPNDLIGMLSYSNRIIKGETNERRTSLFKEYLNG